MPEVGNFFGFRILGRVGSIVLLNFVYDPGYLQTAMEVPYVILNDDTLLSIAFKFNTTVRFYNFFATH